MNRLKKIDLKEILGILKFLVVLVPSMFFKIFLKIRKKELWLVCEKENMARDNGYAFYKYLRENHKEVNAYYAIRKKCNDYRNVERFGNIVEWGSFRHYFLYMVASENISSHKEGNPNHLIFSILHRIFNLYNNRCFLQHGVLYEKFDMFNYKNTKFKIFISGAQKEYNFIKENYGYPDNNLAYTGLARFDNLDFNKKENKKIIFIPTWRRWIGSEKELLLSEYYKRIDSFINSQKLQEILEKYDKYLYFYPHVQMQKFIKNFKTVNNRVKICNFESFNIQKLINEGAMLITDYSSVFTDFAFLEKPILYYQFDRKKFYTEHVQNYPYINFEKEGFGDIIYNEIELIDKIEKNIKCDFKMSEKYIENVNNFFGIRDHKNCERIFNKIVEGKK